METAASSPDPLLARWQQLIRQRPLPLITVRRSDNLSIDVLNQFK
jgi:hypothetical protein